MITSMLVGASLGTAYFYALQKTAFKETSRSLASGISWGLGGLILRLSLFVLIFVCLVRFSNLNFPWLIIGFITAFPLLLFRAAGKMILSDLKNREEQSVRRI